MEYRLYNHKMEHTLVMENLMIELIESHTLFLEIYFSAAKLGAIFVPLNFRLTNQKLEYRINNCNPKILVFHDVFLKKIEAIRIKVKVEK